MTSSKTPKLPSSAEGMSAFKAALKSKIGPTCWYQVALLQLDPASMKDLDESLADSTIPMSVIRDVVMKTFKIPVSGNRASEHRNRECSCYQED
jgi:hypothetical protein